MPLFMDVHSINGGVGLDDVEAHGLVADGICPVQEGSQVWGASPSPASG